MSGCKGNCGGCCGKCGGCGSTMVLAAEEIAMLQQLGQIPFLPVARRADSMTPVYLEGDLSPEQSGKVLQCLEKRGLISIDYDRPLRDGYGPAYEKYPIKGSVTLTAGGYQVLEIIDIQGVQ